MYNTSYIESQIVGEARLFNLRLATSLGKGKPRIKNRFLQLLTRSQCLGRYILKYKKGYNKTMKTHVVDP